MNRRHYILDNHKVVPVDLMTWAKWFEDFENRRVDSTVIGDARVSTVFLSLDHGIDSDAPQLFETMVFGGALDDTQERCSTWEQAEAMHAAICARVRAAA